MTKTSDFGSLPISKIRPIKGTRKAVGLRGDGSIVLLEETMKAGILRVRVLNLLERWRLSGLITPREVSAARNFHADYTTFHRQPNYSTSSLIYVDGGKRGERVSLGHLKERARKRLNHAYSMVGIIATPVIIEVIGEDKPLFKCMVPKDRAKRILLKALPYLADAYGYGK